MNLTENQKRVLLGISQHPNAQDSELEKILGIKSTTITAARKRLSELNLYKEVVIPLVNRLNFELLGINFTNFTPGLSVEERQAKTRQSFEAREEIFLSIGDSQKGFSMSFCKNYTQFYHINEERTQTFGRLKIIGKGHPQEAVFPFASTDFINFFNYSRAIEQVFNFNQDETLKNQERSNELTNFFQPLQAFTISEKEQKIMAELILDPQQTNQAIALTTQSHRHTVARARKILFEEKVIQKTIIPNLTALGFKIMVFYHFKYNASNPPKLQDLQEMNSPFVIFFAHKTFESVVIAIYQDFQTYSQDRSHIINHLEKRQLLSEISDIHEYTLNNVAKIKDLTFYPLILKEFMESIKK